MSSTELKKLPKETNRFKANGHNYVVTTNLSTVRFKYKAMLELELSFGADFNGVMKQVRAAFDDLNGNNIKPADCSVKLYNLMQSIKYVQDREPAILRYCALFINREDEDLSVYNEDLQEEKINDWHQEGFSINDFFPLATSLVAGFKENYQDITQSISRREKKEQ